MSWKVEAAFDLEKARKEILIKKIDTALSEFEKKPTVGRLEDIRGKTNP